ncbi:MAG TPA: hypothetical protein VD994_01975 [Prosthecobacter sp.]|nr:hypothetical protein [Prosthecobacter sp.]
MTERASKEAKNTNASVEMDANDVKSSETASSVLDSAFAEYPVEYSGKRSYHSHVDVFDGTSISGWVIQCDKPDTDIELELIVDSSKRFTIAATVYRPDLAAKFNTAGRHGFRYPTPAILLDGKPHDTKLLIKGTALTVRNAPNMFLAPTNPVYDGVIEEPSGRKVSGTVTLTSDEITPVLVLLVNGQPMATAFADTAVAGRQWRSIGVELRRFDFNLPESALDGEEYSIDIKIANTNTSVKGCPFKFTAVKSDQSAQESSKKNEALERLLAKLATV